MLQTCYRSFYDVAGGRTRPSSALWTCDCSSICLTTRWRAKLRLTGGAVRYIVICNRTPANAERVVAHFQSLFKRDNDLPINGTEVRFHILKTRDEPWPADYRAPTILISCIPTHQIGDEPAPNFTAPEAWLTSPTGGVIFELGYKTLDTPLLQQARAAAPKGWVAMDGIDLLPEQGFAQFELFTGRRAPRGLMRRALFQHYKDENGSWLIPGLRRRMQMMPR